MDYDGDGDLDLVTGSDDCCDFDYEFFLFRRRADGRFQARESIHFTGIGALLTPRTKVCVADWDRDGRPDLMLHQSPGVHLALGPLADRAELALSRQIEGSEPLRVIFTRPNVLDWDGDGVPDLLVGMREPNGEDVYLLRGIADAGGTRLAAPERLLLAVPKGARIRGLDVTDWDADGVSDLIVGLTWSKRHWGAARPTWTRRSQVWVYRRLPPD